MTCKDCAASTETGSNWRQYDSPKCIYCTARLIKQIGTLRAPTSAEIVARKRAVLADAMEWGHQEAQVRALVKDGPLVEPVGGKRK